MPPAEIPPGNEGRAIDTAPRKELREGESDQRPWGFVEVESKGENVFEGPDGLPPKTFKKQLFKKEVSPDLLNVQGWGALFSHYVGKPEPKGRLAEKEVLASTVTDYIALVKKGPTPEEYRHFLIQTLVPAYNRANVNSRRCCWCGTAFKVRQGERQITKYCPPAQGGKRSLCAKKAENLSQAKARRERTVEDIEKRIQEIGEEVKVHKCLTPRTCGHGGSGFCANARRAGTDNLSKLLQELTRRTKGKDVYAERETALDYDVEGRDDDE